MFDDIHEDIRDMFDAALESYLESDAYRDKKNKIDEKFRALRSELDESQQARLNELLDDLDNHYNGFALTAFDKAFVLGIAFREES